MAQNRSNLTTVLVVLAVLLLGVPATTGAVSAQPTPENTSTPTDAAEDFRQPPSVSIQPRQTTITEGSSGTIALFVRNPDVNSQTLVVDTLMNVPPGVTMTGSRLASGSGGGSVAATYEIAPGTSRTLELDVYPTETGEVFVDGTLTYWPEGNKDYYTTRNPNFPFTVEGVPDVPDPNELGENETIVGPDNTEEPPEPEPGMLLYGGVGGLLLLVGVALVRGMGPVSIEWEE
jgi:hypothetical protein